MKPPRHEPIGMHLTRTHKLVSRAFDAALAEAGGSLAQWLVLVSVKERRHGAQSHLAEAVGIEGATLTHHLHRMEAAGLVVRTRSPENRRRYQVELTDAGEAAFHRLLSAVVAFDDRLRTGLSQREVTAFGRTLDRMLVNVTEDPS